MTPDTLEALLKGVSDAYKAHPDPQFRTLPTDVLVALGCLQEHHGEGMPSDVAAQASGLLERLYGWLTDFREFCPSHGRGGDPC